MSLHTKIEAAIENGLFASRWLMAPFYIGLVAALFVLLASFCLELTHLLGKLPSITVNDAILGVLSLIDISLAGNLLVLVIFTGYENFVSKLDIGDHEDLPDWKGKVGFSGLKLKLISSIVAISGIHLLKVFMEIDKFTETEIMWMVIIHLTFVVSGILLAAMDYVASKTEHTH